MTSCQTRLVSITNHLMKRKTREDNGVIYACGFHRDNVIWGFKPHLLMRFQMPNSLSSAETPLNADQTGILLYDPSFHQVNILNALSRMGRCLQFWQSVRHTTGVKNLDIERKQDIHFACNLLKNCNKIEEMYCRLKPTKPII